MIFQQKPIDKNQKNFTHAIGSIMQNDTPGNLFNNLVQNSLDGILAFDREYRLTLWNPTMERISGFESPEVLGKSVFELFPFLKETGEDLSLFQALEGKNIVTRERRYTIPETGREGFFEGHYSPLRGESGEIIGSLAMIRDITERKRSEEALRETNQTLEALIEASPLAMISLDLDGKVEMWNSAAEQIFGWTEKEVIGRFNPIIPKEQEDGFRERVAALLKGTPSLTVEVQRQKKDGSRIDLTLSTAPLRDAKGKIRGFMGILADMTKRKRAEEALQIKTDQLAAITEAMTSYLKTGNWREASRQLLQAALAQTKSESGFIGVLVEGPALRVFAAEGMIWNRVSDHSFSEKVQSYHELGHLDFTDLNNLFGSVITSGEPVLTNEPSADPRSAGLPSGHLPLFNFLGVPILLEGEVVGMIGVANRKEGYTGREQTAIEVLTQAAGVLYDSYRRRNREAALENQRRAAEEAFRESEGRFRRVVESNMIGIVFSDVNGKITEANEAFLQITGYTREDLLLEKVNWKEMTPPEYRHLDLKALTEMATLGVCSAFEKEFIRKDGSRTPVMIGAALLEGSQQNTVGFVFDITKRKQAEEALKKSEARFRRLYESNLLGIAFWDAAGKISDANGAFLQMIGYTQEDLQSGRIDWREITPAEHLPLDEKGLIEIAERGVCTPFEKEYIRKDGSRIPVFIGGASLEGQQPDQGICFILDMTDRKRANELLQKSEAHLRAVIDSEPECVKTVSVDGTLLAMNPAGLAMIQARDEQEVIGRNTFELVHPEDHVVYRRLHQSASQGESGTLQFRLIGLQGRVRWVETYSVPLKDPLGNIDSILSVTRDITERKEAEEELFESQRIHSTLMSNLPGYAYRCKNNREWAMEFASEGILPLTGYAPSDFIDGKIVIGELIHPDDRGPVWDTVQAALLEKKPFQLIYRLRTAYGEKWAWEQGRGVFSSAGELLFLEGFVTDMTERKQVEEVIRQSNERFHLATRATNDAIWDWDLVTNAVWWTENFQTLFKYKSVNMQSRFDWFSERLHPEDREPVLSDVLAAIARGEEFWSGEYRFLRGDGTYATILSRGYIVHDEKEKPVRMIGAMMDITERKRAEDELQKSREQLRDLSAHLQSRLEEERTRIAREIHDEFGQVLTVLKMELSWLQKRFSGKQQTWREKVQSMSKLIDAAIQTVRKTATDLRPGILDDLGLTAAIEWQAQEFEKRTGIPCRWNVVPEDIVVDPDRSTALFRILQETLTNVARHAKASQVNIRLMEKDHSLVLDVTDNGTGITENQATDSKSLGLLGIRERVRLLGGNVTFLGEEGKGTEVHVQLPIERRNLPQRDYD
jgi:PAS domain S-box-containing protein